MKRILALVFLAAACLLDIACAVNERIHYYTLAPTGYPPVTSNSTAPVILVGHVVAPPEIADPRIRYRAGYEVGGYEYQRWAERPPEIVRDLLIRALRASGQYRLVGEAAADTPGDYLLRGRLFDFSEIDQPAFESRVSLRLELVDRKTSQVVWSSHLEHAEPIQSKTMNDVVASFDRNLHQIMAEAATGISGYLSAHR